jgi:solute carrier family 26, other
MPFSASLSRSVIQQTVGGKTQIASVVSCAILVTVLLWIGPFFELLPRCVLASIIVVALKGMLMQLQEFKKFLNLSWIDAVVWMATFLSVVIFAIDIGLLVGIILSVASIFFRALKPYTCLLRHVPNTDLYLDAERYQSAQEIPYVKIFHYCGSLNFASRHTFKARLMQLLNLNLVKEIKSLNKLLDSIDAEAKPAKYQPPAFKCLILDFSALAYIDPSGVATLKLLIKDFNKLGITVCICGCSCPVYETMTRCGLRETNETNSVKLFPTVHNAVLYANEYVSPISVITS